MSVGSVNIVREGLVLCLDGENIKSYPGSGDNWYDITSNYNNGVLTNGATFSPSGNGSIQFDGINDYVEFGDILDLGTNSLTINLWLNLNSKTIGDMFLSKAFANVGDYRYSVGIDYYGSGGLVAFMIGNTGIATDIYAVGATDVPLNTWFMCTFVFDRSSDIKIYYNGVLENLTFPQGGDATISQWLGQDFQSNNPFRIGCYTAYDNVTPNYFMSGKISTSQVYFRTLTPSEVLQNYNSIKWRFMNESEVLPSIVTDQLYLNLDAANSLSYPGSGTTWYDLTVNSHNATLTNGAYYDPSDSGVMIFDGINDYANVGSLGSGFGIFTLDMWFNSSSVIDYKNIIDFNGFNTMLRIEQYTSPGYYATWVNNGYSRARMSISLNGSGSGSFGFGGDCPGVITDNTWYNLVVTYDGTYCSIYINNQKLVNNYLVTGGFVGYINNMRIGDGYDYSSRRFQGKIPVVRIYKKALSDSEVLQNYNVQKSRYGL